MRTAILVALTVLAGRTSVARGDLVAPAPRAAPPCQPGRLVFSAPYLPSQIRLVQAQTVDGLRFSFDTKACGPRPWVAGLVRGYG